jgi:hypothetical protein
VDAAMACRLELMKVNVALAAIERIDRLNRNRDQAERQVSPPAGSMLRALPFCGHAPSHVHFVCPIYEPVAV